MLSPELLRETLDTANVECWERERTANGLAEVAAWSIVTIRLISLLTGNLPLMTLASNYASSIQLSRETSETTLEATLSA